MSSPTMSARSAFSKDPTDTEYTVFGDLQSSDNAETADLSDLLLIRTYMPQFTVPSALFEFTLTCDSGEPGLASRWGRVLIMCDPVSDEESRGKQPAGTAPLLLEEMTRIIDQVIAPVMTDVMGRTAPTALLDTDTAERSAGEGLARLMLGLHDDPKIEGSTFDPGRLEGAELSVVVTQSRLPSVNPKGYERSRAVKTDVSRFLRLGWVW